MLDNIVYIKTQKGQNEIATRAHALSLRQRRLLILVDGQCDGKSLVAKAAMLGDAPDVFDDLVAKGFVAPINGGYGLAETKPVPVPMLAALPSVPPSHRPAVLDAATPVVQRAPAITRRSLALARLYLMEAMGRMLGKESDTLRETMRKATTREALLEHLKLCLEIVEETGGQERARNLKAKVLELLPVD